MKLYFMYNIVVKDLDHSLVDRVVKRFYGKWLNIADEPQPYSYNIVLNKCFEKPKLLSPSTVEVCVSSENQKSIVTGIEQGKALLRQAVSWDGSTYLLSLEGEELEDYQIHPAYDVFIWRAGAEENVLLEVGADPGLNPLIHKRFGGEHYIYAGPHLYGKLIVPDEECLLKFTPHRSVHMDNDLVKFVELNRSTMAYHVAVARKFLDSLGEPDVVLVSFSGGKDSLVTLDLALKHYGRDVVRAVYVDTGVDFPQTTVFVEEVSAKLGVEVEKIRVPVREALSERGLPSKTNRWCTVLKTQGFRKVLERYRERYRRILVLVGDRDAESEARARKPPVRRREGYLEASPIKQWSTVHVQLYAWIHNLPENPLYLQGFYRLGCYICPALTGLEKRVMYTKLYNSLKQLEWFELFIKKACREMASQV